MESGDDRRVRELPYDVVDVFADAPFAGNQLAVVHGATDLPDETLLAVAREFGYSETAFPEPTGLGEYGVRIFTPGGEIPFAGHPTLGTAWVLRKNGELREDDVVQRCGAGAVPVRFLGDLVELTATPRTLDGPLDETATTALARAVGLDAGDVAGPAWTAGAGLDFSYLPVRPDAVARARAAGSGSDVDVFAFTGHDPVRVHCRVFVPDLAVPEDPATGSAAAGLGMVLAASGVVPEGGDVEVAQGLEMGRPSRIYLSVEAQGGTATGVRVAGRVFGVARGTIDVPLA